MSKTQTSSSSGGGYSFLEELRNPSSDLKKWLLLTAIACILLSLPLGVLFAIK